MSELSRLLERRRRLDEEGTVVFDSVEYRGTDPESSTDKDDATQIAAFRSGWSSTPKFQEYGGVKSYAVPTNAKPSASPEIGGRLPVPALAAVLEEQDARGLRKASADDDDAARPQALANPGSSNAELFAPPPQEGGGAGGSTADGTGPPRPVASPALSAASVRGMDPSSSADIGGTPRRRASLPESRSDARTQQQKKRLDKLLSLATAENERLVKLIEGANEDGAKQSEQIQKLLESKKDGDRLLAETRRQREQLEHTLKETEEARDFAQKQNQELVEEREKLESLVASARVGNEPLEAVVAYVMKEKSRLEVVASQKESLEKQLIKAREMAAELDEKARKADELEEEVKRGEQEQAHLRQLLKDGDEDAQRQREQLEGKLKETEEARDLAQKQNQELAVEREKLLGLIASSRVENEKLEAFVADVMKEKSLLELLASKKVSLEKQLITAREVASELDEEARKADQLEEEIKKSEQEQARLRQLLKDGDEESEELRRHCEQLQALKKAKAAHDSLEVDARQREKVEQALTHLEEENKRLEEEVSTAVSTYCGMLQKAELVKSFDTDAVQLREGLVFAKAEFGANEERLGSMTNDEAVLRTRLNGVNRLSGMSTPSAASSRAAEIYSICDPFEAEDLDNSRGSMVCLPEGSPLDADRCKSRRRQLVAAARMWRHQLSELLEKGTVSTASSRTTTPKDGEGAQWLPADGDLHSSTSVSEVYKDAALRVAEVAPLEERLRVLAQEAAALGPASVQSSPGAGSTSGGEKWCVVAIERERAVLQNHLDKASALALVIASEDRVLATAREGAEARAQLDAQELADRRFAACQEAINELLGRTAEREALSLQLSEALNRTAELQQQINVEVHTMSAVAKAAEESSNVYLLQKLDSLISHFDSPEPKPEPVAPSWYETFFGSS